MPRLISKLLFGLQLLGSEQLRDAGAGIAVAIHWITLITAMGKLPLQRLADLSRAMTDMDNILPQSRPS